MQAAVSSTIHDARILIVDDVELNILMIEKTLRQRGFSNFLHAQHGEEALEIAQATPPDMVILDIQMPVMDGFECLHRFRALPAHRDTPILMQTVLTEPQARVKAFREGATDIISKPLDAEELYARCVVHLEKQYYLQKLQNYHTRTSNELEIARDLQLSILPTTQELADIRARTQLNIAAHFRPSSELGGDFWGVKKLYPYQTAFWLVDFSGHGVSAAINVFRLHAYLQEHTPLTSRPGDYLSQLNEKLLELLQPGQFATMFYGILDQLGNKLHYASAGSPHPLIRRRDGSSEIIDATGLPLGMSLHHYPTQSVPLYPGDQLLFYSDALTETRGAYGKFTSENELLALLNENCDAQAAEIVTHILREKIEDRADALRDDLTICACCWMTMGRSDHERLIF